MPFYEYRCTACGHQDTFLESIHAPQKKTCPQCRKRAAFRRLVSAAGFQLKGDGWYVTDFKNKDKPPAKGGKGEAEGKDGKDGAEKVDKADKSAADNAKSTDKTEGKAAKDGGGKEKAKKQPAGD